MREIEVAKPLATFLWFFLATLALAAIGAEFPRLRQHVGDILQEQIAGKTIIAFSGIAVLLAFGCAIRNIAKPSQYSKKIGYLIIDPTNFMVTLAFVAAAVNWGITLSSYVLFPLVVRGEIFKFAVLNSMEISTIALVLGAFVVALHHRPAEPKTIDPFGTPGKIAFWAVFGICLVFLVFFFARLVVLISSS
ncbi:hypothetical protein [Stenotrophomonas maltophilia]|uniref:hypothetical protein n=1 Tax=Stenotrophomonas maltophilia TaxID=40324 RepID=UPI0011B70093|nr:hypothetical protein [Stenotrophomonas maltophilia]